MHGITVVTGASGFIGKRLHDILRAQGKDVIGWTRSMGDLRDSSAVQSRLAALKPDRILHLAASPVSSATTAWTLIAEEQRMLTNLVYSMPGHCQLIYTGSMAEFGRSGTFDERDYCAPDTSYGCAKYACTTQVLALRSLLGLDLRVIRLFGVYGPGEDPSRLLPSLISRLMRGQTVPLSDGLQVRDFIHVEDVASAIFAISSAIDALPIINVGTGVGVSVREVCETVASILGADQGLLQFGVTPRRPVDQDCLVACTAGLRTIMEPPVQRWKVPSMAAECVAEFLEIAR